MTSILLTGPASEPVTLAEAKSWLRVDNTAEDELITGLIAASRLMVEALTCSLLISQHWRLFRDAWPAERILRLPLAPFRSLDSIQVYSASGVASSLAATDYSLDAAPFHARILFVKAPPAPERALAGISLDVTVGYGPSAEDVPRPLRQAICMMVARLYENRGDAASESLPPAIAALLAPYRHVRLA